MTTIGQAYDRIAAWCCAGLACTILAALVAVSSCGCRTIETGREARPYDQLLDPVTEEVPRVIVL